MPIICAADKKKCKEGSCDVCMPEKIRKYSQRIERLEKALRKIKDAPGGGPGKRIATLALEN